MKYYLPRPIFGYLLLSMIGMGILGGIVIGGYSIAAIDLSEKKRMYLLLTGFCLFVLFFIARAYYKRDRRNYVELAKEYIEWVTHSRAGVKIERINTTDIRLFEIVYFEGAKHPSFYNVFDSTDKKISDWGLELFAIPNETILQYCYEQGISPLMTTIKYTEIETVIATKKALKIRYCENFPLFIGKSIKIPFRDIVHIGFVSTHPISKTEDHYVVTTLEGTIYRFSTRSVDEKALAQCATGNGLVIHQPDNLYQK